MKENLKQQCELFTSNREQLKNNFRWENGAIYPLCASLYTEKGLEVDVMRIKEARDLIKEQTRLFSEFRGNVLMVLAAKLAMDENPGEKFKRIKKVYELFKTRFWASPYIALAAISVEEQVPEEKYKEIVEKTITLYNRMKSEHPFLTSKEDISFAILFANSEIEEEVAVKRMEKYYRLLNGSFFSSNAVQSLSHSLAFSEEAEEAVCNRFMKLFERLKDNGCKYGTGIEMATLGLLVLTIDDDQVEEALKDILEVNRYLLNSKGFGAFGVGKVQRLMYSVLMTAMFYQSAGQRMGETFINSMMSILLAQQAAMTSAAAASASQV